MEAMRHARTLGRGVATMTTSVFRPSRPLIAAGALLSVTAFAACESVSGPADNPRETSVSFNVAGAAASRAAGVDLLLITEGQHTLDLQSLDVVVDDAAFQRVRGSSDDGGKCGKCDDDSDDRKRFVRVGAATLEVPLEGGVITPFRGVLPEGEYDRLRLDFAFIRMQGTYDDKPFDVTLPIDAKFDIDLDPTLLIEEDGDAPNVTVDLDLRDWLVHGGDVVDPLRLQTDRSYRAHFVNRIRASLRAFQDCDRDGDHADSDSDGHKHRHRKGKKH